MKHQWTFMRLLISFLLITVLLTNVFSPASHAASKFKDVDPSKIPWAIDAINFMYDQGVINGYADGTFRPEKPVTKAELGVMIYRLFDHIRAKEKIDSTKIVDLPQNHWAYNELLDVYFDHLYLAAGWYDEKQDTYQLQPDKAVTRWEAMLIIDDMFPRFPGEPPEPTQKEELLTIGKMKDIEIKPVRAENEWSDYNDMFFPHIRANLKEGWIDGNGDFEYLKAYALYRMHTLGIITADKNGYFRPNDKITRAEILTILYRVYQSYKGDKPTQTPSSTANQSGGNLIGSLSEAAELSGDLAYGELKFTVTCPDGANYMKLNIKSTEKVDAYAMFDGKTAFIRQEEMSKVKVPVKGLESLEIKTQVRQPNLNKRNVSYKATVSVSFE